MALICSLASPAGWAEIYRCTDAEGTIAYSEEPCPDGTTSGTRTGISLTGNDTMSRTEARRLSRQRTESMRHSSRVYQRMRQGDRSGSKNSRKRRASDYASKGTLARVCGKAFDGVNATHIAGLEHSLKIRLSFKQMSNRAKDIRELRCRLKRLYATN